MGETSLMRVLVTGGAGYIGGIVVRELLACGHDVAVLDDLSHGHRRAVRVGTVLHRVDILDREATARVLAEGYDAVMHFAALSLVAESALEPRRYFDVNVRGAMNLLEAMEATGSRRLVVSSSAAVYGDPETTPIGEDAPTRPTSAYGASKLAMDHLLAFAAPAASIGAVSLRYFNVAGAANGLGEAHDPETHLIPNALATARGGGPLLVHGTDYPTPDGTAVRDYIHVADLARAHVLALGATDEPGHRVYNLGNGAGFSVRDVLASARAVTGRPIPAIESPRRTGDPAVLVASGALARAELGWVPARPALADMIADAWSWLGDTGRHAEPAAVVAS
jgi:UDP-glucose 4-epimerase